MFFSPYVFIRKKKNKNKNRKLLERAAADRAKKQKKEEEETRRMEAAKERELRKQHVPKRSLVCLVFYFIKVIRKCHSR